MRFKKLRIMIGIALFAFFFIVGNTIAFGHFLYSDNSNKTIIDTTNSSYALIKDDSKVNISNGGPRIITNTARATSSGSKDTQKTTTASTTTTPDSTPQVTTPTPTPTPTPTTTVTHTRRTRAS